MVKNKTWVSDMFREIGLYLAASSRSRYRQLQHLRELDAERLADIGVTAGEAQRGRRNAASAPLPLREEAVAPRHAGTARAGAI